MVVAGIGAIALVASIASWFLPGIGIGVGLIMVGVALELPWRSP